MPLSASVRRRQAGVLIVGTVEPEVQPWLRAAGHAPRACPAVEAALEAHDEVPADLVVVDREAGGRETSAVCRALREDERLGDAWILAITPSSRGRLADEVLAAGADDFLPRPYTRRQLLARAGAGLRAAQQRADGSLLSALLVNVPGAIYRSAWHAGHRLELISDEIERISGYPPVNFVASERRTIMNIVHADDRARVERRLAEAAEHGEPFAVEYRIRRADGEVRWVLDRGQLVPGPGGRMWMDGAIFDVTERRAAEQEQRRREIEAARTAELQASRARIVEAADAARRKIERDLHDGAQQRLVSLVLEATLARARFEGDPTSAGPFLERLGQELTEASAELRELARGIHPALLSERGLGPAIAALATRAPVPVEVVEVPEDRLPAAIETTAYFTVAEALTNVAKYAEATHATARLALADGALVVEVRDDGIGGAQAAAGSGLSGLGDRIGAVAGELEVVSPPGEGTLVRAVLPATVPSSA